MKPELSDTQFIQVWNELRSPVAISKAIGVSPRSIYNRRRTLEKKYNISLSITGGHAGRFHSVGGQYSNRLNLGIRNGTVMVFSDAHFWPGLRTTAFRGLLWAIKELQPAAVVNNGDAFDGASISRHPRIMWQQMPSAAEEIQACQDALGEIEKLAKPNCRLIWALGNHDARFESRLANGTPEFEKVAGFKLRDHFPKWEPTWSVWLNDAVVVKHRFKGGVHATHNNTVASGKSMVTGHLHSLKVTPFSDYGGTRFGVDTGTLADPEGPQFRDYTEDNPLNWRSGFAVLTFKDGQMLWPELAHRFSDNVLEFRGKLIDV
jgi:hypothetical protein